MFDFNFAFLTESVLLGFGLAMDAFSVSLANGLHEPNMKKKRVFGIAGTFCGFQFLMPMIGWICVHTILNLFTSFKNMIPWIALALLLYIGISMLVGAFKKKDEDQELKKVGIKALLLQGIATSIDALSVGFTIAEDPYYIALIRSAIIGVVTLGICVGGIFIGKKFGTKLSNKADILGGIILIAIGIKIFVQAAIEGGIVFW